VDFWNDDPVAADAERRRRVALLAEEADLAPGDDDDTDDDVDVVVMVEDPMSAANLEQLLKLDAHQPHDRVPSAPTPTPPVLAEPDPVTPLPVTAPPVSASFFSDVVAGLDPARELDPRDDVDQWADPTRARTSVWPVVGVVLAPVAVFAAVFAAASGQDAAPAGPAIPAGITGPTALCTSVQDATAAVVFGLPGGEYAAGVMPGADQIPTWEIGGQTVALTAEQLGALPAC
jgi:hypothetical protein